MRIKRHYRFHLFLYLITDIYNSVPNINKAVLSTHCHNDLGLASANSLAAILAGARQVHCTINGIGERAGNASLEEVVMALAVRKDAFKGLSTGIKTKEIYRTSHLVSTMTGFLVPPNKAIVGAMPLHMKRVSTRMACSNTRTLMKS